jgi:hypothetical protein
VNTIAELDDSTLDDRLDAQRDIIRQSINEIANGRHARDDCDTARSIERRLAAGIGNSLSNSRREGRLRPVASTRTALRYCERLGDKCRRRDGQMIRVCGPAEFWVANSPVVASVPPRGSRTRHDA